MKVCTYKIDFNILEGNFSHHNIKKCAHFYSILIQQIYTDKFHFVIYLFDYSKNILTFYKH